LNKTLYIDANDTQRGAFKNHKTRRNIFPQCSGGVCGRRAGINEKPRDFQLPLSCFLSFVRCRNNIVLIWRLAKLYLELEHTGCLCLRTAKFSPSPVIRKQIPLLVDSHGHLSADKVFLKLNIYWWISFFNENGWKLAQMGNLFSRGRGAECGGDEILWPLSTLLKTAFSLMGIELEWISRQHKKPCKSDRNNISQQHKTFFNKPRRCSGWKLSIKTVFCFEQGEHNATFRSYANQANNMHQTHSLKRERISTKYEQKGSDTIFGLCSKLKLKKENV